MAQQTNIEWTESTWNPWKGCHKVSQGCKNCYMFREQHRWGNDPNVVTRTKKFNEPLKWKEPRLIFTCSWSDFFIEEADKWRNEAWEIIRKTPQHTYQILTKRPERIRQCLPSFELPNVWFGVTVEDNKAVRRIEVLDRQLYNTNFYLNGRFISFEPLIERIDLSSLAWMAVNNDLFNWMIVGGESGPNARPADMIWFMELLKLEKTCFKPFFMKQLGGVVNKRDKMEDFPEDLRIREFPKVWSEKK